MKFSGIDHFNIIYKWWKNKQNLRSKGANKQKYWIWHGITQDEKLQRSGVYTGIKADKKGYL